MTKIGCGNGLKAVRTGGIDAMQNSLHAQLAQMSDAQLQRLLLWLDERGAATGRSFAVHQRDPGDACSRELVELTLGEAHAVRRPRLPRLAELSSPNVQTVTSSTARLARKLSSAAALTSALAAYIGIWISGLLAVGWLMRF